MIKQATFTRVQTTANRRIYSICYVLALLIVLLTNSGCADSQRAQGNVQPTPQYQSLDYSLDENWAYFESDGTKEADCLIINPTSASSNEGSFNIDLDVPEYRDKFMAALNMERHVYDGNANMYAPFYRSATLDTYTVASPSAYSDAIELAYTDAAAAIDYFLSHAQTNRPLFLAGFSQGSQHLLRYLQEKGNNPVLQNRLVAVYALGWCFSPEEVDPYPWIHMAQKEDDVGTVITFDCEAPDITSTVIVSAGKFTYSINPLLWTTTNEVADKSLNKGACFYDGNAQLVKEVANLTGCYIKPQRGTLACPDIDKSEYPGQIFPDGIYHVNDYKFFCRNMQENMETRLRAFLGE